MCCDPVKYNLRQTGTCPQAWMGVVEMYSGELWSANCWIYLVYRWWWQRWFRGCKQDPFCWSCAASQCSSGSVCLGVWIPDWMWCSCLFEQNLEAGVCGGLTAGRWALRQGAGWAAQNGAELREKEDISLELVTAGRGRAAFQLAWRLYQGMCVTGGLGGAVHWATPSASTAQRRSDVIRLVDCGVVFLPFHTGMCFCLLSALLVTTFHQPVFVGMVSPRYQWQKIRQPSSYLLVCVLR